MQVCDCLHGKAGLRTFLKEVQSPSQSASIILVYLVDLMGAKTKVIVIQKGSCPLLFLNDNDPVFCTLHLASHILELISFQGHKPTHVFKTRKVGAD